MNAGRSDQHSPARDQRAGGRPRKYAEPSQPVTLTLPQTTLRQLEHVDADRGRAIVKLAKEASRGAEIEQPPVELVDIGEGNGLVVIGAAGILKTISFVRLVEVSPGRHLIALLPGHGIHELEVALGDLLDEQNNAADAALITRLLELLRNFRKSESVSTAEILLLRLPTGS